MLGSRQLPRHIVLWLDTLDSRLLYCLQDCLSMLAACAQCWGPTQLPTCWAGMMGRAKTIACASSAICMLLKGRGTLCLSALPCSLCGCHSAFLSAAEDTMQPFKAACTGWMGGASHHMHVIF